MARVPAVERSLRVLELMAEERSPLTLTEIASRTAIPTASCHAILHTLEENGYAARTVIGRSHYWRATLTLYHLGAALVNRLGITDVAQPRLRALAESVGCPAHIGVIEGTDVMYVAKAPAPAFIQFDTYPGKASPFHLTALGRAIVAFAPPERRIGLVEGLPERYRKIIAETARRGYAVEQDEEIEGVGCVAAPIRNADGEVRASIGITGFNADLFVAGDVPSARAVLDAAAAVSADLGYARRAAAAPLT